MAIRYARGGEKIGVVTSGSPAPFLKKNIALAYVPIQYAGVDEVVAVEIRGQLVKARVVATPFYKRPKKRRRVWARKSTEASG
jgi:aminomethyltransferase